MPHARASRSLQPNRADLTRPNAQQAPKQPYGEAAQQRAAQQALPMATPPAPASSPGAAPSPAGGPSLPPAGPPTPLAIPGANGSISRPTERPNEPVTHGLPMGPGGGPEVLDGIGGAARQGAVEQGTLQHLLMGMAQNPDATTAIKDLAARALSGVL